MSQAPPALSPSLPHIDLNVVVGAQGANLIFAFSPMPLGQTPVGGGLVLETGVPPSSS